jgi:hypothetical protein
MAAKMRERAARHHTPDLVDHYLDQAARWESGEPVEVVPGWQLPPEFRPAGAQRTDEFSVGPTGALVRVRRVYPSRGEVRFVPDE